MLGFTLFHGYEKNHVYIFFNPHITQRDVVLEMMCFDMWSKTFMDCTVWSLGYEVQNQCGCVSSFLWFSFNSVRSPSLCNQGHWGSAAVKWLAGQPFWEGTSSWSELRPVSYSIHPCTKIRHQQSYNCPTLEALCLIRTRCVHEYHDFCSFLGSLIHPSSLQNTFSPCVTLPQQAPLTSLYHGHSPCTSQLVIDFFFSFTAHLLVPS